MIETEFWIITAYTLDSRWPIVPSYINIFMPWIKCEIPLLSFLCVRLLNGICFAWWNFLLMDSKPLSMIQISVLACDWYWKSICHSKATKRGFKYKAIVLLGLDLNALCMCLDSQVVRLLDYNGNQRWGQNKVSPESVAFSHGYWQGFLTLDKSYNLKLIWGSALIIWSICSFPSLSARRRVQNEIICVCVHKENCPPRTEYLDSSYYRPSPSCAHKK